jgi:serine/threonine-protein kinase
LAPHLPPELSRIISKSLEKLPEARFQSAGEFHAALSRVTLENPLNSDAAKILQGVPAPDAPTATLRIEAPLGDEATPTPPVPQTSTASKSWDPVVLENTRKNLAVFVGPMAKFLVNRAAKNARNVAELYQALASEITAAADREKFLRSQPL